MSRANDPTVGSTIPDVPEDAEAHASRPTFDRPAERFALGAEIGRGGMGRVLAATDVSLGREVAIKQMLSERPDDLTRFEREVRITAQLEHPSIVPIYEAARDEQGRAYYVMRRIAGEPLSKRLAGRDLRARLALLPNVLAVVDAAAFAHARQIIHRDIKPSNILLGDYGETLLIDWGLARRLDESDVGGQLSSEHSGQLTRAGHVYGTVAYMAPEQARGEPVDQRADVYALGATLFHVLAGSPPFADLSDAERIAAAETGEDAAPVGKLDPEIPPELVAIVSKAMARDRDVRYAHAGELAADLRAFLAGKLVGAHRYTPGQRLSRFVRRHRLVVAISTIAVIALATVGIVAIQNVVAQRNEARAAEADAARAAAEARRQSERATDEQITARLHNASMLAEVDPARAVNLLRDLPAKHRSRARDIAEKAAAYGIPHGSTLHKSSIFTLAMAPDGVRLASGDRKGVVGLHHLEKVESRVLAQLTDEVRLVHWIENGAALVVVTKGAVFRIDPITGDRRQLAAGTELLDPWTVRDSRVRFVERATNRLLELSVQGGEPTVLAEAVDQAAGADEIALVAGNGALRLLVGTKLIPLPGKFGNINTHAVAVSMEQARIAHTTLDHVYEWDFTGRQVRSWAMPMVGLTYVGSKLYGVINGRLMLLGNSIIEVARSRGSVGWPTTGKHGTTFVFDDGLVVVLGKLGQIERTFPHLGTRLAAAGPTSRFVAVGSTDGFIRWWDFDAIVPPAISLPHTLVCWADRDWVVVKSHHALISIDRKTGEQRVIDLGIVGISTVCLGRFGRYLAHYFPVKPSGRVGYVDLATGKGVELPAGASIAVDGPREVLIVVEGRELFEMAQTGERTRVWTAPADISSLATRNGWNAIATVDHTLTRLSPVRAVTTARLHARPDLLRITATGDIYLAFGRELLWWNGTGDPKRVHTLPALPEIAITHGDRLSITLADRSIWVASRDGARNMYPHQRQDVALGDGDLAMVKDHKSLISVRLGSGERVTRWFPSNVFAVAVMGDGRGMVASFPKDVLAVFDDLGPADPDALPAWIDAATNARIDPDTDQLRWK